jgi:hypothetical protein
MVCDWLTVGLAWFWFWFWLVVFGSGLVWFWPRLVRLGLAWFGLVWFGSVWFGLRLSPFRLDD